MLEDGVTGSSKSLTRGNLCYRSEATGETKNNANWWKKCICGRDESKFRHKRKVMFTLICLHFASFLVEPFVL